MFSVSEAAAELKVSDSLIYSLCKRRKLRHERHGLGKGVIRISEEALAEYRRECEVGTEVEEPAASPLPRRRPGQGDDFGNYYRKVMDEVARKTRR
jgi:excisionase family DNA binding protein